MSTFFTSPQGPSVGAAAPPAFSTAPWGAQPSPAPPPARPSSASALQVPDYDSIFHGKLWRDISALADAVWKNKIKERGSGDRAGASTPRMTASSASSPPVSSWEGQELEARIRLHQDLWVSEACSSSSSSAAGLGGTDPAQPSPWKVTPHQRQHYLDHPEQFPDIEIPASEGSAPPLSPPRSSGVQEQPQPGRRARLNRILLGQVFQLCHELNVGEEVALCLLMRVLSTHPHQQKQNQSSSMAAAGLLAACRQLYFHEKCSALSALLRVVQYRLECPEVVAATDGLLVHDLVPKLLVSIREHTNIAKDLRRRYHDERDLLAAAAAPVPTSSSPATTSSSNVTVIQWHLRYHAAQRQAACRVLFYVAYKTQLTAGEVASVVDVIHDLSQNLDVLDPVDDVPSPFVETGAPPSHNPRVGGTWNYPYSPAPHPPSNNVNATMKDEVEWQRELVDSVHESSLPDLLRAVSTLIMTALCALETQAVLTDRHTHADNPFGQGNALAPPNAAPQDLHNLLAPLHARLNRDAASQWARPDILGVLLASYSLLLRSPAAAAPTSPSGSTFAASPAASASIDLRRAWRECLEAPAELKSFTFARMGLVPALLSAGTDPSELDILGGDGGRHKNDKCVCDAAEFLVAVLARFASSYLTELSATGDLPISRVKWEQDAEATLALRRTQKEEQRSFQEWSNTNDVVDGASDIIPTSVDLTQRPDCMDDVIAFVSAVAAIGPDCAAKFWSYVDPDEANSDIRLVPSLALQGLDRQQEDDESLLPCYLTFLAALALADGGAAAIHHQVLLAPLEEGRNGQLSWGSILRILHWYSQKLGKDEFGSSPGVKAAAALHTSTSYYYAYEDSTDAGPDMSWVRDGAEHRQGVSNSTDLSEASAFMLMSHLRFLSTICWGCPAARAALLGSATFQGSGLSGSAASIDQDSTLVILFSLAVAPLPPDLRGAVFTALASLLAVEPSEENSSQIQASAVTAWQILDQCQILPIYLLDQYPSTFEKSSKNYVGLRFPPASVALVVEKPGRSWIPPESMYSIIYEMEYIEASKGVYHSTEGFVRLLRVLFRTKGAPDDLGSSWRARAGCTPYVEYVARYILPRATGAFQGCAPLPFRSSQDKDRLVALSLEVVAEVASEYVVFSPSKAIPESLLPTEVAKKCRQLYESSLDAHGMHLLVSDIVCEPSTQDARQFMLDWTSPHAPDLALLDVSAASAAIEDQSASHTLRRKLGSPSPRPKSPSLSVLTDLLHESGGILLRSIVRVIAGSATQKIAGLDSDCSSLALALFNATRPNLLGLTFSSTFASSKRIISPLQDDIESLCSSGAANWGERATLAALKTLCAALVREDQLIEACNSLSGAGSLVPVLSFRDRSQGVSHPEVWSLKLSRLSQLIMSSNVDSRVLCHLVDLVGHVSMNDVLDVSIAQASTLIVLYVKESLSRLTSLTTLYPSTEEGERKLALAFGTRLSVCGGRVQSEGDVDVVRVILSHLLRDLRKSVLPPESTCLSLLGVPSKSTGAWIDCAQRETNCLSSLLFVLSEDEFHLSPFTADLAPMAYEVIARLMTLTGDEIEQVSARIQYIAARLRHVDFWRFHLSTIISRLEAGGPIPHDDLMHSSAWLLKSVAIEVELLRGDLVGNPQFGQLERLATYFFAPPSDILSKLVRLIPLQRPDLDTSAIKPPEQALLLAMAPVSGAPEVVDGYEVIQLDRLRNVAGFREKPDVLAMEAWCRLWNASVQRDCSTAHLSSAIYFFLGSALVSESAHNSRQPSIEPGLGGLLVDVLSRLNALDLNSSCFALATRNLALSALVVSREFGRGSDGPGTTVYLLDGALVRSLAANSVISSGSHLDVYVSDRLLHERTALLGTVLSALLENASSFDLDGLAPAFVNAATALAALSLDVTRSSGYIATPTNASAIARDCLSVMFDKLRDSTLSGGQSFTQRVLFNPYNGDNFLMSYMRLVRSLDWNLTRLLLSISTQSAGSQLLLDAGIVDAVVEASGRYQEEESRALSTNVGSVEVEVPAFFSGHVELLVSLLMNGVDVDQGSVLSKCERFLLNYERVLDRIATQFPRPLPLVQQVGRLYLAVAHLSRRPNSAQLMSNALESKFVGLAFKLSCFPLPERFLPTLPEPLRGPAKRLTPITFSNDVDKSWWASIDVLVEGLASDSFDSLTQIIEYALNGAEVAKALMWSLLDKPAISASVDLRQISRCLCRCCDALQVIECYALGRGNAVRAAFASEDAFKLQSLLWDVVLEVLILLLKRVRLCSKRPITMLLPIDFPHESVEEMKYVIFVALDHCSFDLARTWSSTVGAQRDVVVSVARTLRREVEGLM